jgi:uncharacterized protein YjbI with pentapeptide repeats
VLKNTDLTNTIMFGAKTKGVDFSTAILNEGTICPSGYPSSCR